VKELIEASLLYVGALPQDLRNTGEFLAHRRVNFMIRLPFQHRRAKDDIYNTFLEQLEIIQDKLPFFEFINISAKLKKMPEFVDLEYVRDALMDEKPEDLTSVSIFLHSQKVRFRLLRLILSLF
jgi:hypothetical protein